MKKWIIGGMIVGVICPILGALSPNLSIPASLGWLVLTLFPFGFITLGISLENTPLLFWKIYAIASILNIGLYTFFGLLIGAIVRGIRRK